MSRELWSRGELLVCLAFYSASPYPKNFSRELVIEIAKILRNRTPSSISIRLANFTARDPQMKMLGHSGMYGGGQKVDNLWSEFLDCQGHLSQTKVLLGVFQSVDVDAL